MIIHHIENVRVAFALVIGAGLATALGACVVFFPSLVKLASRRVLASGLALSAGVMTYVSFVEILVKSLDSFAKAGFDEAKSYIYATLSFYGGVFTMGILDVTVKLLSGEYHSHGPDVYSETTPKKEVTHEITDTGVHSPHCPCCAEDPVAELEEFRRRAAEEVEAMARQEETAVGSVNAFEDDNFDENPIPQNSENCRCDNCEVSNKEHCNITPIEEGKITPIEPGNSLCDSADKPSKTTGEGKKQGDKKLMKMGLTTALAIGLHNFPEGLATFVAALSDPAVGAVLAIAIGIHNIPEGLCVALPVYYATGSRWKGFLWALLSGVSEPIAALLGWLILASYFTPVVYAILFGLVSGMMVTISIKELLPTAHRYDPLDTVVTPSFVTGMAVMSLSLVLFKL